MGGGRDPPGPAPHTNCSSRAAYRKTRADSRPRKCRQRSQRPAEPTSGRRRRRPHRPLAEAACRAACREDLARPAPPAPVPRPLPAPSGPPGRGRRVSGQDLGRPSLTQPDLASVPGWPLSPGDRCGGGGRLGAALEGTSGLLPRFGPTPVGIPVFRFTQGAVGTALGSRRTGRGAWPWLLEGTTQKRNRRTRNLLPGGGGRPLGSVRPGEGQLSCHENIQEAYGEPYGNRSPANSQQVTEWCPRLCEGAGRHPSLPSSQNSLQWLTWTL